MGKNYELPKIEEVILPESDVKDNTSKTDVKKDITLTDIYISRLDDFADFAAGKLGFANIEAKQKKGLEFIKLLDNMLKLEYRDVRVCLRYLIKIMGANPEPFASGSVFAVYYTMKSLPYGYKLDRFIETLTFFSSLQAELKFASRFVESRDLPMIFKGWGRTERDNLIMFANSYVN